VVPDATFRGFSPENKETNSMRNVLKALLVVAVAAPAIANAAIANTRHDLASTSTAVVKSTTTDQTCIFCHAPHRANQQQLIWNHAPALTAGGWALVGGVNQATVAGTTLPVALGPKSQVCLSCHDGSVSLGNLASGAQTVPAVAGETNATGNLINATYLVGPAMGTATSGNHPVSIPYASMTYNGITSTAAVAGYQTVKSAGCASPSGLCTNDAANGTTVQLFGTATAAGIECGSCHDVHNALATNAFFLRAPTAGSAICKACHIK
jgi:predicted CXXCH cytochrome family protein